jgi:hypothetical protein
MASFADEVAASLSPRVSLPDEFRSLFEWMDAHGYVGGYRNNGKRYAGLYPPELADEGTSLVTFHAVDRDYVRGWTRVNEEEAARLAPIVRTGGDGSHASLWIDDEGKQRFVHLGSGSGSTMLCVLTDSPVDMLRLIAIGYDELCWPENFTATPEEARGFDDDEDYVAPLDFRSFVEASFGVKVPGMASEIVGSTASLLDKSSDDPFWRWKNSFDS